MADLPPPPTNWQPTSPPEPVKAKPTWRKERTRKQKIASNVLAGIGILFILLVIVVAVAPQPPEKHAKWQASIKWDVSEIVDASTIKVWVTTKNVGQATARPDCSISLHSSYSDDFGYETFTIDRLAPGHQQTWNALVSISNNGAQHITRDMSKVTCTDS